MKTILPIPDWWYFYVEGQRTPWETTGTYSDAFLFAMALKAYLGRELWTKARPEEIRKVILDNLDNTEDSDTLESLVLIVDLKWPELTEFFSELDDDLNVSNTTVAKRQPFSDALLVDLPDRCVGHIKTGRIIFPRKPPIDMQ